MNSMGLDIEEAERELHPIFKTDPQYLCCFLNKKVVITTVRSRSYTGWVYTVDPVTHNWVIFSDTDLNDDGTPKLHLIMKWSIIDVKIIDGECPQQIMELSKHLLVDKQVVVDNEKLSLRKDAVCRWFTANRIPIKRSDNSLILADGALIINPPYTVDACISSNTIILSRIKTLLSTMPSKYDTDL